MLSSWTTLTLLAPPFLAGSAGCALLLRAGAAYSGGRPREGGRLGRRAGWLTFGGGTTLGIVVAALSLTGAALPGMAALPGAALAGASGVAGLLGGLSGKPRPADGFAVALLLVSAACIAVAA